MKLCLNEKPILCCPQPGISHHLDHLANLCSSILHRHDQARHDQAYFNNAKTMLEYSINFEERDVQRVGVDIVEIARIDEAMRRFGQRFLERIYTDQELTLCKAKPNRLAVRFAGKEAVMKALGTGVKGVSWREIEVLSKPSGDPYVLLNGKAVIIASKLGLSEFAISLSHSKEYAVATVIATTGQG